MFAKGDYIQVTNHGVTDMKTRLYIVWIKGDRAATERRIEAHVKADALFIYARQYGIKSFTCDAMLVR